MIANKKKRRSFWSEESRAKLGMTSDSRLSGDHAERGDSPKRRESQPEGTLSGPKDR